MRERKVEKLIVEKRGRKREEEKREKEKKRKKKRKKKVGVAPIYRLYNLYSPLYIDYI